MNKELTTNVLYYINKISFLADNNFVTELIYVGKEVHTIENGVTYATPEVIASSLKEDIPYIEAGKPFEDIDIKVDLAEEQALELVELINDEQQFHEKAATFFS